MFNVFSCPGYHFYVRPDGSRTKDMSQARTFEKREDAEKFRREMNEESGVMNYVGNHVSRIG